MFESWLVTLKLTFNSSVAGITTIPIPVVSHLSYMMLIRFNSLGLLSELGGERSVFQVEKPLPTRAIWSRILDVIE